MRHKSSQDLVLALSVQVRTVVRTLGYIAQHRHCLVSQSCTVHSDSHCSVLRSHSACHNALVPLLGRTHRIVEWWSSRLIAGDLDAEYGRWHSECQSQWHSGNQSEVSVSGQEDFEQQYWLFDQVDSVWLLLQGQVLCWVVVDAHQQ